MKVASKRGSAFQNFVFDESTVLILSVVVLEMFTQRYVVANKDNGEIKAM